MILPVAVADLVPEGVEPTTKLLAKGVKEGESTEKFLTIGDSIPPIPKGTSASRS